ncbi:MAG: putative toxin-antitoxin system toxin component, PIN family [Sphaerochaeta sp.]|nr:putative toxin-antitoxin system toxin component, PIN family [Spirochaetota bacterium]TAH57893.1 MAG: putative toxin-antitoxin system toxin component, PIN family [Sphaerochaeta sp.]HRV24161.1 putative toxin-antitoxin system toxin component, PIN family [Sphaerochaeta sp.]
MKIMIDTNIFISAALFPKGRAAEAFYKALASPYQPVICDYIIDELHRKFQEKFADRTFELKVFLSMVLPVFEVVSVPEEALEAETKIRDPKDRPILRAALNAGADLFLTGDKDFLESAVEEPRIISVQTFLDV